MQPITPAAVPRSRPLLSSEEISSRWQSTLDHITGSGGMVIAVDAVRDRNSHATIVLMTTSDGQVSQHRFDSGEGQYWHNFQGWLASHIESLSSGRLVALLTTLPNWAGRPIAQVHAFAPHLVLPLRMAPGEMLTVLEQERARIRRAMHTHAQVEEIGTDASRHIQRYGGTTWAWVSAAGRFRTYRSDRQLSTNAAETLAILCAVSCYEQDVPLRIVSDSKVAVAAVHDLQQRAVSAEHVAARLAIPRAAKALCKKLAWAARELPLRSIEVEWVRGHDGHALNEAANRLAILARRAAVSGCPPEVYASMCQGVVQDLTVELSA